MLLEIGHGTDLHGADYTKAAVRAVRDALQRCSLTFLRVLDIDPAAMRVAVSVGAQRPEAVDVAAVAAEFPYGTVTVEAVTGGLDIPAEDGGDRAVVASVAILVSCPAPA